MIAPGVAVRDALDSASVAIAASGSDTPSLDAELLLAHELRCTRVELIMRPRRIVTGTDIRDFRELVHRRSIDQEPIAYLLGHRSFRRIELHVDHRVLIPRPETEDLVEVALELDPGARVLDLGTGSGAIALAVKDERPDLEVHASDVSEEALDVARENARRLGLDVTFHHSDLLYDVPDVDAILSNPPYVMPGDPLSPEVARHEPRVALMGGEDGLGVIRGMIRGAEERGVGFLAIEVGFGQATAVAELMESRRVEVRRDLAGIERVVCGWR